MKILKKYFDHEDVEIILGGIAFAGCLVFIAFGMPTLADLYQSL